MPRTGALCGPKEKVDVQRTEIGEQGKCCQAPCRRRAKLGRGWWVVRVFACLMCSRVVAAPWVVPEWGHGQAGLEPEFPPGSLFWHTNEYPTCPVLFRTVLHVERRSLSCAGFVMRGSKWAYVFVNGQQVASQEPEEQAELLPPLEVELTHLLRPGPNALVISTGSGGLWLDGGIFYADGQRHRFGTNARGFRVQKFPPLTILELLPCMDPSFDDADWFPVGERAGDDVQLSDEELRAVCARLAQERLRRWDEDGAWRLGILDSKGLAVVDWEPHGWGGPGRLPPWVIEAAAAPTPSDAQPGTLYWQAEAICRYVVLRDEATNLANHAVGLRALAAPTTDVAACEKAAAEMAPALGEMEKALRAGRFREALEAAATAEQAAARARHGRILNDLNCALDNKFSWFDSARLLDSDPKHWGLALGPRASVFASSLSPAAFVTLAGEEIVIEGWQKLPPLRLYDQPPLLGPVSLWAVLGGEVVSLRPDASGTVYDRAAHGPLSENWVLLVEALNRGGRLPIEMVFLQAPQRISFMAGDGGTAQVRVIFATPGARLFLLRPLKEWRGFLAQAQTLTGDLKDPAVRGAAERYIQPCRLWSRAVLNYPVTFSEVFMRDPEDNWALRVADVYNYWEFRDEWGTEPLRLAPLPPLASYGLMVGYPGLKILGRAQVLGSRGVWGDEVAAVGQSFITYRVPLDPMKRFGGFTAFCFGPTDIGGPGSLTEILAIKVTGANSFRPQHNQTGEAAMKTVNWCWENGLQHVFNIDEKWVADVIEHYQRLAEQCKDYPPDAVAYDLLNEPETRDPSAYNALVRKVTAAIRAIDRSHLIYVEVIPPWGPGASPYPEAAFETLRPTGDPLSCYSFHDYEFRLPPRWPNDEHDVRDILARWLPAFRFSIDHRAPIHLGEFGAFEQTGQSVFDNPCALTLMADYLRIFDQFGWHWHYYSDRGTLRVRADGSLQESYVQQACRRFFARGTFNANRAGPPPR